ncbi:MAG: hypothetical protein V4561_13780 [Bacteroidota bacterium]
MTNKDMQDNDTILVTQSFGRESEYRRVAFMILSFYAHTQNKSYKTLLFTDNPNWFHPYFEEIPVEFILLTPEKIKSMRGDIDFLHRMKIALIEEAYQMHDANILYADSDTFFIADPAELIDASSPEQSFMHLHEYKFETLSKMELPAGKTFLAFLDLIEHNQFNLSTGVSLFTGSMSSWNAGVMMLHQSHQKFIPDVYALTDQFFPKTQNHASEQYAFSLILQSNTNLKPCDQYIYHYWYGIKKKIIDAFFEGKLSLLVGMTLEQRLSKVKGWVGMLPEYFERHQFTHKDNAIQAFNIRNYKAGYSSSIKAIAKGAWQDFQFLKDILYHTKQFFN